MKEDPEEEKKTLSTLIDHPTVPFLPKRCRLVSRRSCYNGIIESLEALEAATFRLVAPEVCWLGPVGVEFQVEVVTLGSVGEVETICGHYLLMKQVG